jgi:hypothetical protein
MEITTSMVFANFHSTITGSYLVNNSICNNAIDGSNETR